MTYQKRDNRAAFAGDGDIDSVLASSNTGTKNGSIAVIAQDEHLSSICVQNDQQHLITKLRGVNTLIGCNVHNMQGERLGSIKELMLNIETGMVAYAVLSFGVRFTTPEKLFVIPWSCFSPDTESKRLVLDIEKKSFQSCAEIRME
jgi:sporulation protein YlmC with PRC-barrel domain